MSEELVQLNPKYVDMSYIRRFRAKLAISDGIGSVLDMKFIVLRRIGAKGKDRVLKLGILTSDRQHCGCHRDYFFIPAEEVIPHK